LNRPLDDQNKTPQEKVNININAMIPNRDGQRRDVCGADLKYSSVHFLSAAEFVELLRPP